VSEIRVFGSFDDMRLIDDAEVEVIGTFTYTGSEMKPTDVFVTLDGNELTAGTDFEITGYTDNRNAGTATVHLKGIGDYTGRATGSFIIEKATQATPGVPTLLNRTPNLIILTVEQGFQYRRDEGDWQNTAVFDNLTPETTYTFYQRRGETANYLASESSEGAKISTANATNVLELDVCNMPLRAWISNGVLHIGGLTIGQTYRIYTVLGTLVHQGVTTENPMQISLPNRGTYIIHSENRSVKIVW
jgi:hypothetical protein